MHHTIVQLASRSDTTLQCLPCGMSASDEDTSSVRQYDRNTPICHHNVSMLERILQSSVTSVHYPPASAEAKRTCFSEACFSFLLAHNSVRPVSAAQIKQDQRKKQSDPVAQASKQYHRHRRHKSEQCRVHLKVGLGLLQHSQIVPSAWPQPNSL